jgi:thiol-disulfide isomerase/thioredoxin
MVKPGVIILVTVTLVLLIFLMAIFLSGSNKPRTGKQGFEDVNGGKFVLYYADWCPHCKAVKPAFQEFMGDGSVVIEGKRVTIDMVQPEKEPEKAVGVQVEGYPTFLYTDAAGHTVPYEGPRTPEGWMQFLRQKVLS